MMKNIRLNASAHAVRSVLTGARSGTDPITSRGPEVSQKKPSGEREAVDTALSRTHWLV